MIVEIFLFILFIFVIVIYQKNKTKIPNNLKIVPVATGGVPIFGHMFKVKSRQFEYLNNLKDIFGPIYSIQIGWRDFIILNDYETICKALKGQANNFTGRWKGIYEKNVLRSSGIIFTEKKWWMEQRSFTLKVLKDFGFGRKVTEDVVYRETEKLIKNIKSKNGEEIDTNEFVPIVTVNVISSFIMQKEFSESDREAISLITLIKEVFQGNESNSLVLILFPIFEWFPYITKCLMKLFDSSNITKTLEKIIHYIKNIIEERRSKFDPESQCQDIIDAFHLEQHKVKVSNTENSSFTDWQLNILISELFIAGFETTSTTLSWSFLLFAKFAEVQSKMRDEISNEIGFIRSPIMSDKKSLNYCQAVIDEIYRFATVFPLSIAHSNFEEASINGYFIPANSIIFTNLYACHRDYSIWTNPYDFYPEHFLDENGIYKPRPELIPFGLGKRQCIGEQLARMEVFIVVINVLQKFKIHLGKKFVDIETSDLLKGTNGTLRGTLPHTLRFEEIINSE